MPTASILLKIGRICHSQFKCNYLINENLFLNFLFDFWNLNQISNILEKKMMVIANLFPILQTVRILIRPLSKNCRVRECFDSQPVKVSQILVKCKSEHFSHLFSSFWAKLIWKMSPLVLGEIFGAFVDTLPADGKCLLEYYENLRPSLKWNYLKNENVFLNFFLISGIYIKFQTFWKKRWSSLLMCFRNTHCENLG